VPSDAFVNIVPRKADDRSSQSFQTRAKVILSHVSWLLQQKGIREVGDVEYGEDGFVQRFGSPSGIGIEIVSTPKEPAEIRVAIRTSPPSRFRVDTSGEDGKTMDVSLLSQRIADGVFHLAHAIKADKPKPTSPVEGDGDFGSTPRTDLNPKAHHGGAPSKVTPTKTAHGNVTHQVKERSQETQVGHKEPKAKDEDEFEHALVPTQIIAQLTALWTRVRNLPLTTKIAPRVLETIYFAKRSDWKKLKSSLNQVQDAIERHMVKPDDKVLVNGLWRECNSIEQQLRAVHDTRDKSAKGGELNTAMDRLRAVSKPESAKAPFMAGGSGQKFIGSRSRGAVDESLLEALRTTLPDNDGFVNHLSDREMRDFQDVFKKALSFYVPNQRFAFRYAPHLKAWSVKGEDWAASLRCEFRSDDSVVGYMDMARATPPTFLRSGKIEYVDRFDLVTSRYDDLAIKVAQRIASVIKKYKLGRDDRQVPRDQR
jgi:hypothetical protein